MPKQRLSLSWGPSFAELENGSEWFRVYTAQTPIPALLKNLAPSLAPGAELRVSLSVVRRILETRLGNSVAQIVTKGFEHWVLLRQEAEPGRFDLTPSRGEPLSNPEHIFGVTERISADGKVIEKLQHAELEKISAQLKARSIERVCVNLLFANRNPTHQNQIVSHLREQGFQVFARKRDARDSRDELSAWRRNLLDASLSSFFDKIQSEIQEALPDTATRFLETERGFLPAPAVSTSALLFGRERALQGERPFLYFGPEEWCWVLPENRSSWKSPWGAIELTTPETGFFSAQPGRELLLTPEGRVKWGDDAGLDPGPMLWGRSSRLTLLDVMGWHWETTPPLRRTEKSEAKVNEQLDTLKRNSRDWAKTGVEKVRRDISEQLIESLLNDLASQVDSETFEVGGVLGESLLPLLKKARPRWQWSLREGRLRETGVFWEKNFAEEP